MLTVIDFDRQAQPLKTDRHSSIRHRNTSSSQFPVSRLYVHWTGFLNATAFSKDLSLAVICQQRVCQPIHRVQCHRICPSSFVGAGHVLIQTDWLNCILNINKAAVPSKVSGLRQLAPASLWDSRQLLPR